MSAWNTLLVGLGQIGMQYDLHLPVGEFIYTHARAIESHKDFVLLAGVDSSETNRRLFTEQFSAPCYATLNAIAPPLWPDIVVIATPTETHFQVLREVLEHCRPRVVLCEKPLSYSLDESVRMLQMCNDSGVAVFVNYFRSVDAGALEVKRRIQCGEMRGPMRGVIWYSKGFLHNASHFFQLLMTWFGPCTDYTVLDKGRQLSNGDSEPDVRIRFRQGEVYLLARSEADFSHYSIELMFENGRLNYDHGGRSIEWWEARPARDVKGYVYLQEPPERIPNGMSKYQYHVFDDINRFLMQEPAHLCDGKMALGTIETMIAILEKKSE